MATVELTTSLKVLVWERLKVPKATVRSLGGNHRTTLYRSGVEGITVQAIFDGILYSSTPAGLGNIVSSIHNVVRNKCRDCRQGAWNTNVSAPYEGGLPTCSPGATPKHYFRIVQGNGHSSPPEWHQHRGPS